MSGRRNIYKKYTTYYYIMLKLHVVTLKSFVNNWEILSVIKIN